jgi:hypothetical protein
MNYVKQLSPINFPKSPRIQIKVSPKISPVNKQSSSEKNENRLKRVELEEEYSILYTANKLL